jgi:hypothetical protein
MAPERYPGCAFANIQASGRSLSAGEVRVAEGVSLRADAGEFIEQRGQVNPRPAGVRDRPCAAALDPERRPVQKFAYVIVVVGR